MARWAVDFAAVQQIADLGDRCFQVEQARSWDTQIQRTAIADADAQPDPAGRELVQCRHGAGDHARVPAGQVAHTWTEVDALGRDGQRAEHGHRFARGEMRIGDPEDVKAQALRELGGLDHLARGHVGGEAYAEADVRHPAGPEVVDGRPPLRGSLSRDNTTGYDVN